MRKPVGLKALAEELGVDASTVSRALRDDPRVKSETRRLVQELAARHDYRPNTAARALRGGKSGRVAVLLSQPQQRFASPEPLDGGNLLRGRPAQAVSRTRSSSPESLWVAAGTAVK